jgi:hypothetical protein
VLDVSWSTDLVPPRRRRWKIVLLALSVVFVLVVAAAVLLVPWKHDGGIGPQPAWQPPAQTFLRPPMHGQPVPGWRASITDLGLPAAGPGDANQVRIATNAEPFESGPFIGYLGDSAYFVAGNPGAVDPQWWLIGLDVRDGRRLFAPVPLNSGPIAPDCYLNGPNTVLCVKDDVHSGTAWVIDAHAGDVSYTGPTDLRTHPAQLGLRQVGGYAVAETQFQGVYGVGPHAETTWFVPGDGSVDQSKVRNSDAAPTPLATQTMSGRGSNGKIVFSLADGTVITPELDDNAQQQTTVVYPGGFAAEITLSESTSRVQFFDDAGKRASADSIRGTLNIHASDLPIVASAEGTWAAYTPDGGKLLEVSGKSPAATRLIGSALFVDEASDTVDRRWRRYDLRTGAAGEACDYNLGSGYLGSDGTVGVFESGNPNVGLTTTAMDLATCNKLWTIASPAGSFRDVWRVNTTLIQLSDDGTELMSLVPPS